MINPKNSENALKMFQTEFETKHVISEKADMTEVDIKNELTVKDIDYTISSEEYQTLLNLLGGVASNPRLYNLILQLVQRFSTTADYIVEKGTTNDWYYEKHKSGIAKLWARFNIGQVIIGNVLASSGPGVVVSNATSFSFPFEFTEVPFCSINHEGNSTGYTSIQTTGNVSTTTKTYEVRLSRFGTSSVVTQNNIFSIFAVGKYK